MSDSLNKEILSKLDSLVRLQASIAVAQYETQKEKIIFLSSAGLSPSAIAGIIGSTPNSVSVALSKINKKAKGSGGKDSSDGS